MQRDLVHEHCFAAHYFEVSRCILAEPQVCVVMPSEAIVDIDLSRPLTAGNQINVGARVTWGPSQAYCAALGLVTLTETTPGTTVARFEVGRGPGWWLAAGRLTRNWRFNPFELMSNQGAGIVRSWWWQYLPRWVALLEAGRPASAPAAAQPPAPGNPPEAAPQRRDRVQAERQQKLRQQWEAGATLDEAAHALGISPATAGRVSRELGLKWRKTK